MHLLRLNNNELLTLRGMLERMKVEDSRLWTQDHEAVLLKITLAQIDDLEASEESAQAARYAANLHSMPEGS